MCSSAPCIGAPCLEHILAHPEVIAMADEVAVLYVGNHV
jgi:hypothetical protein